MESTRLQDARNFAIAMHGSQSYGAHPYSHHLDAVASILLPYGVEAQVIGWLHDVVEDTEATIADVRDLFGDTVARCVALLTDAPGANRAERKPKTYAKLASASEDDELALIVKAADRLANVRACVTDTNLRLMNIYRDEHAVFRRAAYRPGLCDGMWSELDRLLDASS